MAGSTSRSGSPGCFEACKQNLFSCMRYSIYCKNPYFPHRAIGVVIHENAVIGENARIQANVVIGGKGQSGVPTIGNNVQIGANAVIVGG